MDSLLDGHTPQPIEEDAEKDAIVMQIRINYKSGAYSQAWYKTFNTESSKLDDSILGIEWELAEVHPTSEGQMMTPHVFGLPHIESIWTVSTMTASALYSKSMVV